jgi:putative acetyltransferase
VAGHVLFSPVAVDPAAGRAGALGLAPLAVLPGRQRRGVGSALVRAGLDELRRRGAAAVVVLGHAAYYPRFGFAPASRFGLRCEFDCPDESFLALELRPGALAGGAGVVRYRPEFARF